MSFQNACRVIGAPLGVTNAKEDVFLPSKRGRTARYFLTQFIALWPSGTERSLLPFPRVTMNPRSRLRSSILIAVNSDTLRPVAYNTSSIALSRKPKSIAGSGASSNRSTSSGSKNLGSDCQDLGDSRFALGSRFRMPSNKRYLYNPLVVTRTLAMLFGSSPNLWRY